MDENKGLMDDISRLASEAGSTIRKAGGKALDKFETWRLEQDVSACYTELGRLLFVRLREAAAESSESSVAISGAEELRPTGEMMELMDKIGKLKEEIAIRKATVSVSEKL